MTDNRKPEGKPTPGYGLTIGQIAEVRGIIEKYKVLGLITVKPPMDDKAVANFGNHKGVTSRPSEAK